MNLSPQLRPPQGMDSYDSAIPVESDSAPQSKFRLGKFLAALRKFWWIPLITVILGAGVATALVMRTPPTYISTASLWETEKLRLPGGALFSEDSQTALGTHVELLQSSRLTELTFARLKAQGTNTIPYDKDGRPLPISVRAGLSQRTSVIAISATSSDPAYSQKFLDALIEQFLSYRKDVRKSVSGETLSSISEQVLRLERELKANQLALTAFERTNNLKVILDESAAMGSYMTKLKLQTSDLRLEAELLDASILDQQAASRSNSLASLDNAPAHEIGSAQLTALKDLQMLKLERDRLAKKYRPKHPKIVALDKDIERAQKLTDIFRAQTLDQLTASREALQKKIASVEATIKEWEPKVSEANARVAEADQLRQAIARSQTLYDRFSSVLESVDISRNIDQETLSILETASPAQRIHNKERSAATKAILLGLAFGLGIVAFIAVRDDKITSSSEVLKQLQSPIVGQLPELPKAKSEPELALLAPNDQRHIYAESFRNLRSALLFQAFDENRPKVILVTSSIPGEGKSTVSANLATTMAMGGSRVLLIDGDIRKGKLHKLLQAQAEPGLAEVLCKKAVADSVIQSTNLPNLSFMGRGTQGINPSDLFLGDVTRELLEFLRGKFDHIIIDTCPVFAADDATTLAPLTDGTLFVVRGKHTQAGMAREALELLHQRQAKILGVVFNGTDVSSRSNYYYRYPQYYKS